MFARFRDRPLDPHPWSPPALVGPCEHCGQPKDAAIHTAAAALFAELRGRNEAEDAEYRRVHADCLTLQANLISRVVRLHERVDDLLVEVDELRRANGRGEAT